MLEKIVSGGQTGVDRAALDAATACEIPHGGWCPLGRRAEDGPIAPSYMLRETPEADYRLRTEWNIRDSDATLILNRGTLEGGTSLTAALARRYARPVLIVGLDDAPDAALIRDWVVRCGARVLNVAGPRESRYPGIYRAAFELMLEILGRLRN